MRSCGVRGGCRGTGHRDPSTVHNPPAVFGRGDDGRGAHSVAIHAPNSGMSLRELCCLEKTLITFWGFKTGICGPGGCVISFPLPERVETSRVPGWWWGSRASAGRLAGDVQAKISRASLRKRASSAAGKLG